MKKYLTKGAATAFLVAAASTNLAIADVDMAFGFGISGDYQFANKRFNSIAGFDLQDTKSGNFIIGGNAEFVVGLSEMFALSAGLFVDYSKYDQEFSPEAVTKMKKELGLKTQKQGQIFINPDGSRSPTERHVGLRTEEVKENPFEGAGRIIREYYFRPAPAAPAGQLLFNAALYANLDNTVGADNRHRIVGEVLAAADSFESRRLFQRAITEGAQITPQQADQLVSTFAEVPGNIRMLLHNLLSLDPAAIAAANITPQHLEQMQKMIYKYSKKSNEYGLYRLYAIPTSAALLKNASENVWEDKAQYAKNLAGLEQLINSQDIANKQELKTLISNAKTQTGNALVETLNNLQAQIEKETNEVHKANMLNYFTAAKNALGVAPAGGEVSEATVSDAKLQLKDVRIGFAPAINFMISATDDVSFVIKFGPNIVYHMLKGTASAKVGEDSQSAEFKAKYFSLDPQIGVGVQYKLPGDVAVLKFSVDYQTNNLIKFCGDKLKTTKTGTDEKDVKNLSSILGKDPELEFGSVSHMLGLSLGVNFLL